MTNKKLTMVAGGLCLLFAMFSGCGERSGEKEYNTAMDSWRNGDLVRARTLLEKSIRKSSGNEKKSVAYNQLGLILWQLQETEAAVEAFSKSCTLTDEMTGANLNLGIALLEAGRIDEAEVALNNVLGDAPANAQARATMGLIEMQKKQWPNATRELTAAVRAQPRDSAAHNALALADLHSSRSSETAITRLRQIISTDPAYAPAAYNLAVIYDQWQGNSSAAQEWYRQYLKKAVPGDPRVQTAKDALARLGGTKKVTTGTEASPADPDAAARFIAAGSKLHAEKNYSEAIKQYENAIQADPTQKTAHYNLGLSYYELKNYPEAVTACNNSLKLDPSFSNARYMLALSYLQQRKWSDAEREIGILKQVDAAQAESLSKYMSSLRNQ